MPVRTAEAEWKGNLLEGKGTVKSASGAINTSYDWKARSGDGAGTNPEELIAAAHAGCYSMALSAGLSKAGFTPNSVRTTAKVTFDKVGEGFGITKIELVCQADVPKIDAAAFKAQAEGAKTNCPVSKALASVPITLDAKLK
jgi:osmotically inducible protein OsmC